MNTATLEADRTSAARRFARVATLTIHAGLVVAITIDPSSSQALITAILITLLAVASYTDLRWHRIPNWLTYPALLWTFALVGFSTQWTPEAVLLTNFQATPHRLADAALGGAVSFVGMLMVYRLSGTGAGDVKLATAIGAAVGVQAGVSTILWCHLLAAGGLTAWRAWHADWQCVANAAALRFALPLPFSAVAAAQHAGPTAPTQVPLAAYFAGGVILTLGGASLV